MNKKIYTTVSGFRSGKKERTAAEVSAKKPDQIIKLAVKGMLPKNRLSRQLIKKLKVYPGSEHPHVAQIKNF